MQQKFLLFITILIISLPPVASQYTGEYTLSPYYDVYALIYLPESVFPGETITVEVEVINTGTKTLEFPTIYLHFPGLEKIRDYSAKTLDAFLLPGESKTVYFEINIMDSVSIGDYTIWVTVEQCEELGFCGAGTWTKSFYTTLTVTSPPMGTISVSSTPPEADVYLDGVYRGTTPLIISDVSTGYHTIKITKAGYQDYLIEIYVKADDITYVTASLESNKGMLEIISEPFGASIYLDDVYKGKTPLVIDVSPGRHTLKLAKSGYDEIKKEIYVEQGESKRIELTLIKSARTKFMELKPELENRITSAQELLINLYDLVSAGKNIGADVSEAEKKINSAAQLLKEANESYSAAIQKLNQGDVAAALSSANEAYTKGSSGLAMLEESEPILNSAIKKKLEEKLASTESLVNTAKSVGLAFGAEEKLDQAKSEIEKFDEAFASGDLSKADEYVLNANKLLSEIKTRIYASFGGVAALVGILTVGVVKVRGRLPRRQPEVEVEATQKAARAEEIRKPEYNPSAKAIAVKNLIKRYKNATILENVSFEIEQGKLVAIVGPSGAGKSTLIEAVAGRLTPDEGEIHILGMDARRERMEINRLVGFVPQHPELYMDQKVWQNMMNSAIKWEVKNAEAKAEEILKQLGIYERKDVPAKNLSGGQLKRLSLAMELIREPPILVLDEPTTGLDPTSRDQIITALSKMVFNHGKTCIFTTHFMDEAEHCDEVIIVGDKGIIAKGSPSELARRMPGMGRIVEVALEEVKEELVGKLKEERGIHTVIREGRVLKIIMDSPDAVEVSQKIKSLGGVIEEARVTKAGMKEVFVHYTGMLPEEAK